MKRSDLESLAEQHFRTVEGQIPAEDLETLQSSIHEYIAVTTCRLRRKFLRVSLTDQEMIGFPLDSQKAA